MEFGQGQGFGMRVAKVGGLNLMNHLKSFKTLKGGWDRELESEMENMETRVIMGCCIFVAVFSPFLL